MTAWTAGGLRGDLSIPVSSSAFRASISRPVMSKGRTPGCRRVHVRRADPRDGPIAVHAHGQVATGQCVLATEHLLLADPGDLLKAGADPVRQQFVKRHGLDRRAPRSQPEPPGVHEGGGRDTGPGGNCALSSPPRRPGEVADL